MADEIEQLAQEAAKAMAALDAAAGVEGQVFPLSDNPRTLAIPRLEDYFGVWAIHWPVGHALMEHARDMDLKQHVARYGDDREADQSYIVQDGVALVSISGTLMKSASSLSAATSTVMARRALRQAVADQRVNAILMVIDSPGGTVSGTQALADDVAWAASQKPLESYIEDLGASAAYWIASQAGRISANRTALVGSIGTYMAVNDFSGAAARDGVKVHVIRAGAFKGSGTPGTEVTAPQLAEWQRIVTDLNAHFLEGVAKGRKLSAAQVAQLADGRVHLAEDAKKLGLIDAVESRDAALARLVQRTSQKPKGAKMSEPITAPVQNSLPQPASYADMTQACPGASAEFLCAQLAKNATKEQAVSAFMAHQQAQIESMKAAAQKPGVDPLGGGKKAKAEVDGDPVQAWGAAIDAEMKNGKTKTAAAAAVVKKNPDLHRAFLISHNESNGRRKAAAALAE